MLYRMLKTMIEGQAAYEEFLNTPTPEEDNMAMMIDHEYRLTILEVM